MPGRGNFSLPTQGKASGFFFFLSSVSLFSEASLSGTWWKSAGKVYRPVRATAQNMPWACVPLLWSWAEGPLQLLPSKEILKDTELKPASPKHLWTLRFEFPDTFDLFSWLLPGASRPGSSLPLGWDIFWPSTTRDQERNSPWPWPVPQCCLQIPELQTGSSCFTFHLLPDQRQYYFSFLTFRGIVLKKCSRSCSAWSQSEFF